MPSTTTRRYYSNFAPQQSLASPITNTDLSLAVIGSFAGWSTQFPFFAVINYGKIDAEIVSVTNIVGLTATIIRGQDGSTAQGHAAGATLDPCFIKQDMDEANAHSSATSGVHGVAGPVVGTTDAQTLTNKTLTAPNVNNPAIASGALSGTFSGSPTFSGTPTVAGLTASGDGKLTGVIVPKSYATEAAATTALGTPPAGTTVYLTAPTTGPVGNYAFDGAAWNWVGPASLPRGRVAGARKTATQNITPQNTEVLITSMADITWNVLSGRRYKLTFCMRADSTAGSGISILSVSLRDGGGSAPTVSSTQVAGGTYSCNNTSGASTQDDTHTMIWEFVGGTDISAGSHHVGISMQASGSGTVLYGIVGVPILLIIEDIGI